MSADASGDPAAVPPTNPPADPNSTQPLPTHDRLFDTVPRPESTIAAWLGPDAEPVAGYRLRRLLGRGGFGEVWEAVGPGEVAVAFKFIALGAKGDIEEQALKIIKNVRHPNLLTIFGAWQRDNVLIIGMELADRTLLDRLQEVCRLGQTGIPRGELLRYTMEAAKVLDFLNKPRHFPERGKPVGIQHGDIKPQNILLVGDGVKVGDFGLISLLEKSVTTHGGGMTPAYAPPEFFAGQVTRWSDQYSLAVTYCHLRGGKPPPSPSATPLENATGETVRDLSMLPAEEQPAVKRALAAVPQRRWPNCRVFVRELANPDKRDRDDRPRGFPPPPSDAPPRRDRVAQVQPEPGIADGPSRQPIPAGLTETASLDERVRAGNELVPGYRLTKLLGRGGFGEVWETRGPGGKHCALKIVRNLDAGQGRQVFRSLDLIRDLDHERLIGLQTFWLLDARGAVIDDDQFGMPNVPVPSVLVMAIDLAAMNLLSRWQEYAARGEPGIPAAELLRYVRQAAEGIDYLNAQSIQHRDIKPEHLLLTRDDRVKVSGFSLVKLVEGAAVPVHSASVGLTPAYAAPELFGNTVTRWTDQYSLALTYYKLRTGHWPFPPDSGPFQMMRAHVEGQLDLSAVGESEQRVLARATALEPSARYTSCQEMVEELGQALGIAPTVTLPAPPLTDTATYAPAPVAPAPRLSRPPSLAERAENYLKLPSRASLAPAPPSAKADAWRAPAAKSGSGWGPAVFLLLLLGLVGGGLGYFVRHPAGPQPAPDAESLPLVVTLVLAGAAIGVLILVIVAAAGRRARKSRVSPVSSRPVPTPSQELGDTAPTIVRTMQFGEQIGLAPELVDEMRSLLALGQQRDLTPEEKDRLRELAELSRGPAATEPRQAGLRALPARRSLAGHQDAVWCVAAVGGMRAISGSMDHTLRLWDLRTGREERCLTGHTDGVVSVSVSPTGDEALSASLDGTLRLWDLVSGAEKRVIDAGIGRLFAAALVPGDAPCAVAGGDDGALRLLDLTTGAGVRWFVGHNQRITGLAVSPDGHWVVSASEDHALRLWDVRTGEQQREFIGHAAAVQSVTFTPDGAHLVSGSADHTARWWDVATGAELRRFEGHSDWVRSVSVAPDGRHILTGSDDETVRLWQVPGVVPVRVFNDHVGSVLSVAFAADGRLALSASDDWTVIVRRLDAD